MVSQEHHLAKGEQTMPTTDEQRKQYQTELDGRSTTELVQVLSREAQLQGSRTPGSEDFMDGIILVAMVTAEKGRELAERRRSSASGPHGKRRRQANRADRRLQARELREVRQGWAA